MYTCKYCGKEYTNRFSLLGHLSHCSKNPNKSRTKESWINLHKKSTETLLERNKRYRELHPEKYISKNFECSCIRCGRGYVVNTTEEKYNKGKYKKYCCKSCANTRKHSEETKNKIRLSIQSSEKYKASYIKSLKSLKHYTCKFCGSKFTIKDVRDIGGLVYCSSECKHKWLSQNTGGYRKGSGRGKSGWYKGIHCDSTWELAFVIYHIDHGLSIRRCTERRKYLYNGEEHIYIPDFVTDKGIIEIKGYNTKQWEEKQRQHSDVIVLHKDDIQPYIEYAIKTYGTDFIKLYENKNTPTINTKNNFIWMNNGVDCVYIKNTLYEEYISSGYIRGRI
jgi:hypothetical protein